MLVRTGSFVFLLIAASYFAAGEKDETVSTEPLSSDINVLVKNIDRIKGKVTEMRGVLAGNVTDEIESKLTTSANSLKSVVKDVPSNVTYDDLIERVEKAREKVKALQKTLSDIHSYLDRPIPRPSNTTKNDVGAL